MHKPFILLCLLILFSQCSPKISRHFENTHYVESSYIHIVNDELDFHLKTPADLRFVRNKKELRKRARQLGKAYPGGLLAFGKTTIPPHYEVELYLNPGSAVNSNQYRVAVFDTTLSNQQFVLRCQSIDETDLNSFRSDCQRILRNISVGPNYRSKMASIFDLTGRFGNRFLHGLNRVLGYPTTNRNEKWIKVQMGLNYASFLAPNAVYDSLLNKFPTPPPRDTLESAINNKAVFGGKKVKEYLLEIAEGQQLLMFNENHFYPEHRKMLKLMLPELRKEGYTHLALEALAEGEDSLLNSGAPPTLDTGFYTREQHFAELIRRAQKLGFTFVSYENTDKSKDREEGQADNLYRKTFGVNSESRVIVHAGLDHILEEPAPNGKRWMASYLHKKYRINPLTISQSHLNNYRYVVDSLALISGQHFHQRKLRSIDYHLINNLPLQATSTNYTFTNPFSTSIQISLFLKDEVGNSENYFNKIPYRAGLLQAGEQYSCNLPEGQYLLVLFGGEGEVLRKEWISI